MNASEPDTIDPREAAHFGRLAADWWDPKGSSAMLHRLNPARLRYIRGRTDAHWGGDPASFRPLDGKRALDVGCGAGLLAEPLARLGAAVTAIDAAPENIAVAKAHAAGQGLIIDYRAGGIESLFSDPGQHQPFVSSEVETRGAGVSTSPKGEVYPERLPWQAVEGLDTSGLSRPERFDLVTALEVIEHVADPAAFVRGLAGALAEGGLLILSTPNRTALSRLAIITLGEGTGRIPAGTHDWAKFLKPDELIAHLEAAGLAVVDRAGLTLSLSRGFDTGDNEALDYFLTAVRRGD